MILAAVITDFGPPELLHIAEVEPTTVGPGQIRIDIAASGVNPIDLGTRRGRTIASEKARFPMTLGWDAAGTVIAAGHASQFAVGDRVVAMSAHPGTQIGTYAEQVTLADDRAVAAPVAADLKRLAALPLAGLTARQAIDALGPLAGRTVLVAGAGGAVGSIAVQLARSAGAKVLAYARAADRSYLTGLGAEYVDTIPAGVDAAVDTIGGTVSKQVFAAVRDDGRYVTVVPEFWIPGGQFTAARGVEPVVVGVEMVPSQLRSLATMVAGGELDVRIAAELPLAQAAEAHRRMESGGVGGKLLLVPTR